MCSPIQINTLGYHIVKVAMSSIKIKDDGTWSHSAKHFFSNLFDMKFVEGDEGVNSKKAHELLYALIHDYKHQVDELNIRYELLKMENSLLKRTISP